MSALSGQDYLIHVHKRGAEPFRSLSALSDAEAHGTMRALYLEGSIFWERFKDPEAYWQARKRVEAWLRREFVAKGGRPRSEYPIYMIWGRSKWMETALDEVTRATTVELYVPLSAFEEDTVSFTYPDSMVSFFLNEQRHPAWYLREYHGRVFTLAEMREIVAANGLPGYRWGTDLPSGLANYIEAQVWDPEPLAAFMKGRTEPRRARTGAMSTAPISGGGLLVGDRHRASPYERVLPGLPRSRRPNPSGLHEGKGERPGEC